jgi:hypothetical protein
MCGYGSIVAGDAARRANRGSVGAASGFHSRFRRRIADGFGKKALMIGLSGRRRYMVFGAAAGAALYSPIAVFLGANFGINYEPLLSLMMSERSFYAGIGTVLGFVVCVLTVVAVAAAGAASGALIVLLVRWVARRRVKFGNEWFYGAVGGMLFCPAAAVLMELVFMSGDVPYFPVSHPGHSIGWYDINVESIEAVVPTAMVMFGLFFGSLAGRAVRFDMALGRRYGNALVWGSAFGALVFLPSAVFRGLLFSDIFMLPIVLLMKTADLSLWVVVPIKIAGVILLSCFFILAGGCLGAAAGFAAGRAASAALRPVAGIMRRSEKHPGEI